MYLVYTNPTCLKDYTELLVVDNKWDTKSQGTAPTYLAQAENVEFKGSWRINEGQEIIETGPPVMYWTSMATVHSHHARTLQNECGNCRLQCEDCETQKDPTQGKRRLVLCQVKGRCNLKHPMCQRPISPREESSYSDSYSISILQKQKIHRNRSIELQNYALMTLRNQINPFQYNKNITLTMPRTFPTRNRDIMLFNWVRGDRVHYSKVMLPLWSVLGNSPGQRNETRTYQCSQREVFDTLTDEISCHAKWMKRRPRFKKRDEGRRKMTTVTSDHSSLRNHPSQIKMPQPAPVCSPDREILNWLRIMLN